MTNDGLAPYRALLVRDADDMPFATRVLATADPNQAAAIAVAWALEEMKRIVHVQPTSLVLERGGVRHVMTRWDGVEPAGAGRLAS